MKHQLRFTLWVAIMLLASATHGQERLAPKKIDQFAYMVGEWEGTGTSYSREGPKSFTVRESIAYALDSTILDIRGKGYDQDGGIVHDALGVLYFETREQAYKMHSFTMQGMNALAWIKMGDENSFTWGFSLPDGAEISYSTYFTADTWEEKGFYSPAGTDQQYPTVEMKLTRVW